MNDVTAPALPAPNSVRRPRFEAFRLIHKAIRFVLADVLTRLARGEASYEELEEALVFCERHVEHEETIYRPAIAARQKGPLETFDAGHPVHIRFIAELRALAKNAEAAPPERRAVAERALYLHFSKFVAENLAHMAEEEEVMQPLLERLFTDEELLALQGRLVGSLSREELLLSARCMLRGISRAERIELVRAWAANMPRPAILGLMEAVRPVLAPEVFAELAAIASPSEGAS